MQQLRMQQLSGPTGTVTLLRHTVALRSVALRFPGFGGVSQENRATPPQKGPVAPTFSALEAGVALPVIAWKMSWYRGVSQLHCCLARYRGPLSAAAGERCEDHSRQGSVKILMLVWMMHSWLKSKEVCQKANLRFESIQISIISLCRHSRHQS